MPSTTHTPTTLTASPKIVQCVAWQNNEDTLSLIRRTVFINEQGVTEKDEWDAVDALDDTAHFLVYDDKQAIGCARLLVNGQVGRMAILKPYRGRGFGCLLLRNIIQYQLEKQFLLGSQNAAIFLHAQTSAISFYEKLGFTASGEVFMDAGIPHKTMHWASNRTTLTILYSDKVIRLNSANAFCQHLSQGLLDASRSLDIYCHHLQSCVWANTWVVDMISTLARKSQHSIIRILLHDSQPLHGESHPLVALSQRLSSRVAIRVIHHDIAKVDYAYALIDERRLVYFNEESALKGFANYAAPAECRNLSDEFNRLWDYNSQPDPNLSRLYI